MSETVGLIQCGRCLHWQPQDLQDSRAPQALGCNRCGATVCGKLLRRPLRRSRGNLVAKVLIQAFLLAGIVAYLICVLLESK